MAGQKWTCYFHWIQILKKQLNNTSNMTSRTSTSICAYNIPMPSPWMRQRSTILQLKHGNLAQALSQRMDQSYGRLSGISTTANEVDSWSWKVLVIPISLHSFCAFFARVVIDCALLNCRKRLSS